MKKIFLFICLLSLVFSCFTVSAHAYKPVQVNVSLEIEKGGTAKIIPEVNCPVPEITEETLADGQMGRVDILFSETGVYAYTIATVPDARNIYFDNTVYKIRVYVTDEDGELKASVVVFKEDSKYSANPFPSPLDFIPERLVFVNKEWDNTNRPTEPSSRPDSNPNPANPTDRNKDNNKNNNQNNGRTDNNGNNNKNNDKNHVPYTGDDSRMEMYFLFAILASFGLMMLSIFYLIDTQKFIDKQMNK